MGGGQSSWLLKQNHRAWEMGTAASRHFSPGFLGPHLLPQVVSFPTCSWVSPSSVSRHCSWRNNSGSTPTVCKVLSQVHRDPASPLFSDLQGLAVPGAEPQILSLLFEVLCSLALTPFHAMLCSPLARDSHPCLPPMPPDCLPARLECLPVLQPEKYSDPEIQRENSSSMKSSLLRAPNMGSAAASSTFGGWSFYHPHKKHLDRAQG